MTDDRKQQICVCIYIYIYIIRTLGAYFNSEKKSLRVDKHVEKSESYLHPHGNKCLDAHHARIFLDHIK